MYKFFNENKSLGKMYTVRHFVAEKVTRRTIYSILERSQHFPAQRALGSDTIAKKMSKRQVNKLKRSFNHKDSYSQRQAAKKFGISQPMVSK